MICVSAILTYHSLDESGSVISTAPSLFRKQIEAILAAGLPFRPLADIFQNPGSVALTFDDGFENFREHALPVLIQHGIPATTFVVSGSCGRENNWPSQAPGIPRLPLMSWSALKEIARAGVEIGAHTVTHPDLTKLAAADAQQEIEHSCVEIEQHIGCAVRSFAYPYGAVNPQTLSFARANCDLACSTRLDYVRTGADRACLPRIDSYYLSDPRSLTTLLEDKGQRYIALRRWAREARQWVSR